MSRQQDRCVVPGIILFLAVVTFAIYWRSLSYPVLIFDDSKYLQAPEVRAGLTLHGLWWAFTSIHFANWHPLTSLTYMTLAGIFGQTARPLHALNLSLHVANVLLLFLLLRRLTGALWRSAMVAALFALHPLHVESVVWIAELKDVLSGFFFLLTMLAYREYVYQQGKFRFLLTLGLFMLALLSKPMVVTLPFVMLLVDFWPLRRLSWPGIDTQAGVSVPVPPRISLRAAFLEKVPFFAMVLASSVVTFVVQRRAGAVVSSDILPLAYRFQNATVSYLLYIEKLLWPRYLAAMYPTNPISSNLMTIATLFLVGTTLLAVWFAPRRGYITVGWFWFVGMLVPVIGLVQVGAQAMADRYMYLPLIGLLIIAVWGAAEIASRWRMVAAGVAITAVAGCAARTWFEISYWRDDLTLFTRAAAITQNNWFAAVNKADALTRIGRVDEAIAEYRQILFAFPQCADALHSLGVCYAGQRKYDDAIPLFYEALAIKPEMAECLNALGFALFMDGKPDEAIPYARKAVELKPHDADYKYNLAMPLIKQQKLDEAAVELRDSLKLRPTADAHAALADVLFRQKNFSGSQAEAEKSLRLDDKFAPAHGMLGMLLLRENKQDEAADQFRRAAELDREDLEARLQLASLLMSQGKTVAAEVPLGELLRIAPENARVRLQWGLFHQMCGDTPAAVQSYRKAIELDPHSAARNNLAWILATSSDDNLRDGIQAVKLAQLVHVDFGDRADILDTLAAGYAEEGDFEQAIATAQKALELASVRDQSQLQKEIKMRVELYHQHRPYHESLPQSPVRQTPPKK